MNIVCKNTRVSRKTLKKRFDQKQRTVLLNYLNTVSYLSIQFHITNLERFLINNVLGTYILNYLFVSCGRRSIPSDNNYQYYLQVS